jgi:phosphoribosylglycinamide formyltransferase-1
LDAVAQGQLDADVALVIANRANAAGLLRAEQAGVPTRVIEHKAYADRASFELALVDALREREVNWVVLAGFMRILTARFLTAFPQRVVNIHPSLLPCFPGLDAQAQALAYGVRLTGCTVHLVDEGVDAGPVLSQAVVPLRPEDTRDSLAQRLLPHEHRLLVSTLQWIAEGCLEINAPSEVGARPEITFRGVSPLLGVDPQL